MAKQLGMIDILIDYASDDSCQIQLWAKGHYPSDEFRTACMRALEHWDGRKTDVSEMEVIQSHWRTVKADAETRAQGICDRVHIESAPGRGAYPVTVLKDWLPLHLY